MCKLKFVCLFLKVFFSWRVDSVLDAANCALVTARALRYACRRQGQKLVARLLATVEVFCKAKAEVNCEVSRWADYISIALDEVPLDHWDGVMASVLKDASKSFAGALFIFRVLKSYAFAKPRETAVALVSALGKTTVQGILDEGKVWFSTCLFLTLTCCLFAYFS